MLPSPKEAIALDLLRSGREMYGLEMVKEAGGELVRGTVYVLLDRLEDKGLVSSRARPEGLAGMPRRKYRITGVGRRALAAREAALAALASPVGSPA
jgi:DNA-binding PadR family transcriptional regulator